MSDFDKFFAEKLEEEAHYPGRAKNWHSLNQRLDAFVVGSSVGSAVGSVAWKAVSAVLLVTTAVLVWQYAGLQKEHGQMQQQQQKLEQQIAELQRPAAQQQDVNQQIAKHQQPTDQQPHQNLEQQVAELQRQTAQQPKQQQNVEQQIAELQQQTARQSKQQQYLEQQIAQLRQQAAGQSKSSQRVGQQIAEPQQPVAQRPSSPASSAVAQSIVSQGAGVPPIFPEKKGDTVGAEQAAVVPPVFPEKKDSVADTERTAAAPQPSPLTPSSVPTHPDSASSAVATVPVAATTPDSTAKIAQLAPPDTSAKSAQAPPPPIIKPLRQRFQLKAGMGAIVGWEQPRQQGISLITGQGISASLSLWRSGLWLISGIDWVRFEEKSSTYRPEFHPFAQPPKSPKPSPGPHPHDELVSVESQQRQQRYHLGLRYELPRLLGVRPTLQAGHVWARTAPTFVQYTFDDHDPGPGPNPNPNHKLDFLTQKEGPIKYSNIWQAGLGLEYGLRAWTLSLRADYQAQVGMAKKPTFDAMFLQAGLEYSIR